MKKLNLSWDTVEPVIQRIADLTKIQRILISVAAVIVIVALFVWLLYLPKFERMGELEKNIKQYEEKVEKTKKNAREYETYKKKMEEAKVQFTVVARALPSSDEVPSLLTGISQAGKEAGLKFLLFQPQREKKEDFYAEIPIRMELSGSYHDLGMFYDKLAGLSRIVNVKNFNVNAPSSKQGAASNLKIRCTAVTYKFITPSEKEKNGKKGKGKRKR